MTTPRIQLGRIKATVPANNEVESMIQLDMAIRSALGGIAADPNASVANRGTASAAVMLSQQASSIKTGEPMDVFDLSLAIMFVPTAPFSTGMTNDATVALAGDVACWMVRIQQSKIRLGLIYPANPPPNVPINFEMDTSTQRWADILNRLYLLTATGATALASIRSQIPTSTRVWRLETSDMTWSPTNFDAACADTEPDDNGRQRLPDTSRSSNDDWSDEVVASGAPAQDRMPHDVATFALVLPAFDPSVINESISSAKPPGEMLAAITNRFYRQTNEMRLSLTEKQVKAWVLADFQRHASSLSLSALSPTKSISSIDEVTHATAALIDGEVMIRGEHMRVIADTFFFLIRVNAKQRELGPNSIAQIIESRMARIREPAPPSPSAVPRSKIDEAAARARAAFAIHKHSDDLVEMQRYPMPERPKRYAPPIDRPAPKRPRTENRTMRTVSVPERFRKFENVCYSWLEDANRGTTCRRRSCRWNHTIPSNCSASETDEFRRFLTATDAERQNF